MKMIQKSDKIIMSSENSTTTTTTEVATDFVKKTNFTYPQQSLTIYKTSCMYSTDKSQIQGDCIFTHDNFVFLPRNTKKPWIIEIPWLSILRMTQAQKRMDKGVQFELSNKKTICFTQMKDRDLFWSYVIFLTEVSKAKKPSWGLSSKDETEVVRKLTILRAPHAFEETIQANFSDVMKIMKSADLWTEALTIGGCSNIFVGGWKKTKDGISRIVQYTQPLFQSASVQATHTLMKSGKTGALEIFLCYNRTSQPGFLHVPVQLYFKKDGDSVSYRCAYSLDWITETWDREFVESAVGRLVRMNYHYIKSKILNQKFDESEFEGEWRKHQPFVLVLLSLITAIICVLVSPPKMDWYRVFAGFIAFFFFFVV